MRKLFGVAAIPCASLFLLVFAVYSVRGLFAPELTSARFFGLPTVDADGTLYYRVYLSRNLAIVVAGFVFLIRRQWQPLTVLTTAAVALPVFDATVLYVVLGGATRFAAHVSTFVVISLASVLLWLRVRNAGS
jgi:Domain of unknown function (DUF4267)